METFQISNDSIHLLACGMFDAGFPNPTREAEIDNVFPTATLQMLGALTSNPCPHAADAPAKRKKKHVFVWMLRFNEKSILKTQC